MPRKNKERSQSPHMHYNFKREGHESALGQGYHPTQERGAYNPSLFSPPTHPFSDTGIDRHGPHSDAGTDTSPYNSSEESLYQPNYLGQHTGAYGPIHWDPHFDSYHRGPRMSFEGLHPHPHPHQHSANSNSNIKIHIDNNSPSHHPPLNEKMRQGWDPRFVGALGLGALVGAASGSVGWNAMSPENREEVLSQLKSYWERAKNTADAYLPGAADRESMRNELQKWRDYKANNWNYLFAPLNIGRSFPT